MDNYTKKVSTFKFRFILLLIVISIVILSLQIFVSKYYVGRIVVNKSQSFFEETVSQISKRIDLHMSQADVLVMEIKNDQRIKNYLIEIKNDKVFYYISKYKITREVLRKVNVKIADNIYIYTSNNQPINCCYSQASMETPPILTQYLKEENNLISNNIMWKVKEDDPYTLEAITYIKNGPEIIGLLVVQFNDTIFNDIFEHYGNFDGGKILLLDSSNDIVYYIQKNLINQNVYKLIDKDDITTKLKLGFSDWSLVGILNRDGLSKEITKMNNVFFIIFAIMIGAIMTIPIIISKSIIKPMNKIVQGMQNIQRGNYNFEIQNDAKNEFRMIIDNFNFMVRRIRGLIDTVVQQQRNYRQVEMQAIKSKLNPHFLYNTLDMINWMLILEDKLDISDIVVLLSNILRYSITYEDDLVTIREDLEQMSNYLTIQKLRFNGRLEYEIIAEDHTLDYKIPKLLIQPLIENAIKYAFSDMKKEGHLDISVAENQEDEFIYFTIKDNGIGMSNEEILKIQSGYHKENKKSGFGIQLVQSTIKHTYGDGCGLTILSEENKGTIITAKVGRYLH